MAVGAFARTRTSDPFATPFALGGVATTYPMAATLSIGWCARFKATETTPIAGIRINWSAISVPGTITARIETTDTSTGKPTGTLYDANATKTFTPTVGWQQVTFDTPPTTNRTQGVDYCVVLLTAGTGTTQTLRSSVSFNPYPVALFTASDGSTRSNFTLVSGACPICSLVLTNASEVTEGMCPYAVGGTTVQIYGTRAAGFKFTLLSGAVISGIDCQAMTITGTPTNILAKIFSGSSLVSGSTSTNTFTDMQATTVTRVGRFLFDTGPVTLAAGTYRAVIQQSDTTTASGNRYNLSTGVGVVSDLVPTNVQLTTTLDVTAGSISWTDTTTETPAGMGLIISSLPAGGVSGPTLPIIVNI